MGLTPEQLEKSYEKARETGQTQHLETNPTPEEPNEGIPVTWTKSDSDEPIEAKVLKPGEPYYTGGTVSKRAK